MRWDPGASWRSADFFAALNRPWLNLVPVQTGGGPTTYAGRLAYGRLERVAEIGPANVAATRTLVHTGDVLGQRQRRA
jgi:hypothetical protein